jgi:hypothetical protein
MNDNERATADAQATEAAQSADATIAALATEQASSDSDLDALNNELATNIAQATEAAASLDQMATEQAEVQAVATENAASGADAQATSEAAQNQIATNEADIANLEATSEAAQQAANDAEATSDANSQDIADAQATADAASQELENAQATSAALEEQVQLNSLNPNSVGETFQVDLQGVLSGDPDALDDAADALGEVLDPYVEGENCRIGFVNISSRSNQLGEGVQLSDAIAVIIAQEYPELLPEPADGSDPQLASESIALPGTQPVGEVQLQLFLSSGCTPAG